MTLIVKKSDDPFKKYWWAALLAMGLISLWLCWPALNRSSRLSMASAERDLSSADQSLDAIANSAGAPGKAPGLAMDRSGPYRREIPKDPFASLLFSMGSRPENSPTPKSAAASKSGSPSSWADALAQIASVGSSGKARAVQAAFPSANFGALSGLGGESASSAFAGAGSGPNERRLRAFGTRGPHIAFSQAHGLPDSSAGSSGSSALSALENAAKTASSALGAKKAAASAGMMSRSFDGSAGNGAVGAPRLPGVGGNLSLGAIAKDLKANNPDLNTYKVQPVPATPKPPPQPSMAQQLLQMIMMSLVSGVTGLVSMGIGVSMLKGLGLGLF